MEADRESTGKSRDCVAWGRHISHSERGMKDSELRQTTQVRQGQAENVGWGRCDATGCQTSLQVGETEAGRQRRQKL